MDGYCKLHAKIVMSSIWSEPDHVRLLWITMLAIADSQGNVEGSLCGLANVARIPEASCSEAMAVLMGPDPRSSDGTTGERIKLLEPGVWHIINHNKYRERQTRRQALDAKRKRESRSHVDNADVSAMSQDSVYAFASSVSVPDSSVPKKKKAPKSDTSCELFEQFWDAYPRKTQKGSAMKAWTKMPADHKKLAIAGAKRFAPLVQKKDFIPYPTTWLNGSGWDDNPGDMACCKPANGRATTSDGNRGHMPHDTRLKDYSDTGMDD
jgi:hypothetical protein